MSVNEIFQQECPNSEMPEYMWYSKANNGNLIPYSPKQNRILKLHLGPVERFGTKRLMRARVNIARLAAHA